MNDELDLRAYVAVLWARRYVIAATTLAAIVAAALFSSLHSRGVRGVYEASAALAVAWRFQVPGIDAQAASLSLSSADDLLVLIDNTTAAANVQARLPQGSGATPASLLAQVRFAAIKPNVLQVIVRDASPARAAVVARAWAEAIPEYVESGRRWALQQTLDLLQPRIDAARTAVEKADDAWRAFQSASKIPLLEEQVQESVRRFTLYSAMLEVLKQGGDPTDPAVAPSGEAYRPGGARPRQAQIGKLMSAFRSDLAGEQAALAAERRREEQLARDLEIADLTYRNVMRAAAGLRLFLHGTSAMVIVVTPPPPEGVPVPVVGHRSTSLILAGIFGLAVGIILAFAAEQVAGRPRSVPVGGSSDQASAHGDVKG